MVASVALVHPSHSLSTHAALFGVDSEPPLGVWVGVRAAGAAHPPPGDCIPPVVRWVTIEGRFVCANCVLNLLLFVVIAVNRRSSLICSLVTKFV